MKKYNPEKIESKWRQRWIEDEIYKAPDNNNDKEKFHSLYSFPYPSGAGLHVGHAEGMVANDIAARYWRMRGKSVLFPMGWDSFGLPAENYAIKTGTPPEETTENAIKTFIEQINKLGMSIDWETEVGAHRPNYYKWTQWIFIQLFKQGLAYKKKAPVNWCPKDQTVLANEQVVNGRCERCDTEVIQKDMEQWFFKITDFADRLEKDLDKVDWPNGTKQQQRNWIGRSEGTRIKFEVFDTNDEKVDTLEVFSTAHDTIFGATFMVVAPEHKLITDNISKISNKTEVENYVASTQLKTELERQQQKDKTGVKISGLVAVNPMNRKTIPIFIADYVLVGYGTGAIMAVPGHDERDSEFAKKYNLDIVYVANVDEVTSYNEVIKKNPTDFKLVNSGDYNNLDFKEAREKMLEDMVALGIAAKEVNYRLRDWLVSRQRYWGCPIPIVYDPEGKPHAIEEKDLPLLLPTDIDFKPTGESPIAKSESFKKQAEEKYGEGWHYEVDTMDTFVDSSWYFLRHTSATSEKSAFDIGTVNYWMPVDLYMIGAEHTVLHLLYSRFFTKFLYDQGLVDFEEPFYFMRHMGTILGTDGRKMSKRWGNVINPNDEIEKYGADTVRMYEMFMGPLEEAKPWNDRAENGVFRFLLKVWENKDKVVDIVETNEQKSAISKLIKKVGEDIESLSFNTAIAKMMEFVNFLNKQDEISRDIWEKFLLLIAPFAPYLSEELWSQLGNKYSIHQQPWPQYDDKDLVEDSVHIAVQINGKVRDTVLVNKNDEESKVMEKLKESEKVNKYLTDKKIQKHVYVPGKIVSIVTD